MADDDLLLTNKFVAEDTTQESNNITFTKLMDSKKTSRSNYDPEQPSFTEEIKVNRDSGVSVPENSVAFEQFIKFAQTDKRKKVKKTVINIDSRNRNTKFKFDKQEIMYTGTPLIFTKSLNYFYIDLQVNNSVTDIQSLNQIIITNINRLEFDNIGMDYQSYQFSENSGIPIFNIEEFIYEEANGTQNLNFFDESSKKYIFNKLKLSHPSHIDTSAIKTTKIGNNINIFIITNIKVAYPNPGHYKIDLGDTYSNIYSVRLIASEIPNTSYTFNENLITSSVGNFNLTTKINNKLRWINKIDKVNTVNQNVYQASTLHENMPFIPTINAKDIHNKNFLKLSKLFNINVNNLIKPVAATTINIDLTTNIVDGKNLSLNDYVIVKDQTNKSENGLYKFTSNGLILQSNDNILKQQNINYIYNVSYGIENRDKYYLIEKIDNKYSFIEIEYEKNIRRVYSLIRVSTDIISTNTLSGNNVIIPLNKRDYYSDNRYIGDFTFLNNKILGISQNQITNINETIFGVSDNLHYIVSNNLSSFYFLNAYIGTSNGGNNTYTKISFTNNSEFRIEIYDNLSKNNYFTDFITTLNLGSILPFKIIINGLNSGLNKKYQFYVYKINDTTQVSDRLKKSYNFNCIPIKGDFIGDQKPYHNLNGEILITIFNDFSAENLFNYQKYKPEVYDLLKKYYLTSEIVHVPNNDILQNSLEIIKLNNINTREYYTHQKLQQGLAEGYIIAYHNGNSPGVLITNGTFDNSSNITLSQGLSNVNPGTVTLSFNDTNIENSVAYTIKNNVKSENITNKISSDLELSYAIEYKTYYTYNFSNTTTLSQVKISGNYLQLYNLDMNANSVSEISQVVEEYNYIKINNNFYKIDTNEDISFDTNTKFYSIKIENNWAPPIDNEELQIVKFQKIANTEVKFIYFGSDIESHIIRIYNKNTNMYPYIEFFVGSLVDSRLKKYEIRYRYSVGDINILDNTEKEFKLFKEDNKIYLRDSVNNYIVTKLANNDLDNDGITINPYKICYSINNNEINFNSNNIIIHEYEQAYNTKDFKSDLVDITDYSPSAFISHINSEGIQELSFAKEFIEIEDINKIDILPKINPSTNRIPSYYHLEKNSNNLNINNLSSILKYPVYELSIANAKYSADSIASYLQGALGNIQSRIYDYSKGIFYTDRLISKYVDLNNEYGINQENKFTIKVDNSVNSIVIKQYKKIFDSHKNASTERMRIAYYNEGFPYIYLNIPQVSFSNNSLIYINGFSSLDNISGSSLNGEKNVIMPFNYRVRIRQLVPLPRVESINSSKNLFVKEGYVKTEDDEIYNKFVDYINNSIKKENVKDISLDYIVENIFGIGETNYADFKDLSSEKFKNMKDEFKFNSIPKNNANIYESDLNKAYIDNYGNNITYNKVDDFNATTIPIVSTNSSGLEYYGQALINGYRNEQIYNEYADELEKPPEYSDEVVHGFNVTFFQNEIFMKLSDINTTYKQNIMGRISRIAPNSDRYGNIEIDYDLFSENLLNFKVGDIIVGLDSNTIGVILPYDYSYNSLPNSDVITLGIGAYLMNKSVFDSGAFIEKYISITDVNTTHRELAKTFMNNLSEWQIERNNTNRGFYIYSRTIPNKSKLYGSKINNLQIYQPAFFKFLESEDTALSRLGLVNTTNNTSWNFFKTNYETIFEVSIKRSFFNIAKNNELFTDYIIFETKSTGDFSVNDRIYIENHDIVLKDADFRREKFFNVELIEPYSAFISKLETIYNTSVLNYNGFSGIAHINDIDHTKRDNKFLTDIEYKYSDSEGNSTAKATCIIDASIYELTIVEGGTGYVGIPEINANNPDGNDYAELFTAYNTGTIEKTAIINRGSKFRDIPLITVENSSVNTVAESKIDQGGKLTNIDIYGNNGLNPGYGYTETPTVTVSQSGVQATGVVTVSGIGTISVKTNVVIPDLPVNEGTVQGAFIPTNPQHSSEYENLATSNPNNIEYILIGAPVGSGGITAKAYVLRNGAKFDKVVIYDTGSGYTSTQVITITHFRLTNSDGTFESTTNNFTAAVDALGAIAVGNQGTNYSDNPLYSPNITVTRSSTSSSGTDAICSAYIEPNTNVLALSGGISIIHGGSGYTTGTTITVDPPRAIASANLKKGIIYICIGQCISSISVNSGGSGYVGSDIVKFEGGGNNTHKQLPEAYIQVTDGSITNIILTRLGSGLTENPTLTIKKADGSAVSSGTGATFTINMNTTGNFGSGYSQATTTVDVIGSNSKKIIEIENVPEQLYTRNQIVTQSGTSASGFIVETVKSNCIMVNMSNDNEFNTTGVLTFSAGTSGIIPEITTNNSNVIITSILHPIIESGEIRNIIVKKPGHFDYNPTITVIDSALSNPGTGAVATAIIGNTGRLSDISVDFEGYAYTSNPTVTITEPKITGVLSSSVVDGKISTLTVSNKGTGYTVNPTVNISSNSVSKIYPRIGYGEIEKIIVLNKGSNYKADLTTITVSPPDVTPGIQATCTPIIINFLLVEVVITNPGMGYIKPPTFTITDSSADNAGTGAILKAFISNGSIKNSLIEEQFIDSETVTNPTLTVSQPASNASITASITASIEAITLYDNGKHYTQTPLVFIDNPVPPIGLSGVVATATATLNTLTNQITNITASNGSNYTSIPLVKITPPEKINSNLEDVTEKLTIPFKNKKIYRHLSHDKGDYSINYYLNYKDIASLSESNDFNITILSNYLLKLNIYKNNTTVNLLDTNNSKHDLQIVNFQSDEQLDTTYIKLMSVILIQLTSGQFYKGQIFKQSNTNASGIVYDNTIVNSSYVLVKIIFGEFDSTNNINVTQGTSSHSPSSNFTPIEVYNKVYKNTSDTVNNLIDNSKYHISHKIYRAPIAVDTISDFSTKIYDTTANISKYISKYSTLGIFERMLDEQINKIYQNMKYNMVKGAELYRLYSYNVFRNRIIKIKVCPIDDRGFCFEKVDGNNLDSSTGKATSSNLSERTIKDYSRKLFPYHEYAEIETFIKSEYGSIVDIRGTSYKSYRRPIQKLDNKISSSKSFMPGMGIYAIKETAATGFRDSITHYNNITSTASVPLIYSEYSYNANFLGYVLATSVNNTHEYDRDYRLNAKTFSNVNIEESVFSEYYIYMLIDPDITSKGEIDNLFNTLNQDNVNIVFDASANVDYTTEPLKADGYLTSKNSYYVSSTSNTYQTKTDDKVYTILKNRYGNKGFLNDADEVNIYENSEYNTLISSRSTDGFSNYDSLTNLVASAMTFRKPKLNKTLPYYTFQKRLACATIVERPVAYEIKDDINSKKMFLSGEYDYFYRDYMEKKSVIKYKPHLDKTNIDLMNKHNIISSNITNVNYKEHNYKENNCHSGAIDPNLNETQDFYNNSSFSKLEYESINGNTPIIKLNPGDDIVLVDALKSTYKYSEGPNFKNINNVPDNMLGISNVALKVIQGSVLPSIYMDNSKLYNNILNSYLNNICVIDYNYNSDLERITYNSILGKNKCPRIDIVANNSRYYEQNDELDVIDYNKVTIYSISSANTQTQITISHIIGDTVITSENIDKIKHSIIILSTNIKSNNAVFPIDNTNNCELGIIINAELIDNNTKINLTLENKLYFNHDTNTENIHMKSFIPYSTFKTNSEIANIGSNYSFDVNISTYTNANNIDVGDYIILDWGTQRNIIKKGNIPYKISNEENYNTTISYTTSTYKILSKTITNNIATFTFENPIILYPSETRGIVLKNNFTSKSNLSYNFLSTQPFIVNNEWYTKIFYRGASYNSGLHFNTHYSKKLVFSNINSKYVKSGEPLFNRNYSNTVYIGGMKGIKLPFINISTVDTNGYFGTNGEPEFISKPFDDDYYSILPVFNEDFTINNNTQSILHHIKGEFRDNIDLLTSPGMLGSDVNIENLSINRWYDTVEENEFNYVVVKGFYLGYGGFIEERYNKDSINTIINNDKFIPIKKIKQIDSKFYIYIQFTNVFNNLFNKSNLYKNFNLVNQSNRKSYLDYELNLKLLDELLLQQKQEDYETSIAIFGKNGKIVRKKVLTPYDLNPDNYIYLVIPNLTHLKPIQNENISEAFSKIMLPGDSNRMLFNSFIAGTKIFNNNLFNNLSELEIAFITNDGFLFDFNGSEHSLTLEITEIIDKFEYINPRFGNIEI